MTPQQMSPLPISQIKNLMKQMQGLQNPQAELISRYPILQNVLAIQQKDGVSLKQIAEVMAQQQGRNLNDIIKELQT